MMVDGENSIYVGGLPYDADEQSLRRVFDIYGAVVSVKIVNDQSVRGKCFGFVTFTNPRSAVHAINDMDGRTIDGRVVRVNEVKTRGGRSSFGRERVERNFDRGIESDRGRGREKSHERYHNHREWSRDHDQDREREYDRVHDDARPRDRLVDRDRIQEHDKDSENISRDRGRIQEYDRVHDDARPRDRLADRDRIQEHDKDLENISRDRGRIQEHDKDLENISRDRGRSRDYDLERDIDSDKGMQRTSPDVKSERRDKTQMPDLLERSYSAERGKRSRSSGSSYNGHGEVADQLELENKKLQELQEKVTRIEKIAEEKKQHVLKLKDQAKNMEDSLADARNFTSLRQMQLSKLHKSYQQVRDYSEKLKTADQEFQSLVESIMMEMQFTDGLGGGGIIGHSS